MHDATNTAIDFLADALDDDDTTVLTDEPGDCDFRVGALGEGYVTITDVNDTLSTMYARDLADSLQDELNGFTVTYDQRGASGHGYEIRDEDETAQ